MGFFDKKGNLEKLLRKAAEPTYGQTEETGEPRWKEDAAAVPKKTENPVSAIRQAIAAAQGIKISEVPDAEDSGVEIAPISKVIKEGLAERKREEERKRQAEELSVEENEHGFVIDCAGRNAGKLIFNNGEKGPLLKALESSKPVILTGFEKVRPETDDALESFLNFVSGELHTLVISAQGSFDWRYTQADIKPGFEITMKMRSPQSGGTQSNKFSQRAGSRIKFVRTP